MQYANDIDDLKKKNQSIFTSDLILFFLGYGMIVHRFGWYEAIALFCVLSSVELGAIRGSIMVGELLNRTLKRHDEKPRGYENK